MKIAVLPGDGIGPEIMVQALRVLEVLRQEGLKIEIEEAPLGGSAYDQCGAPYPEVTQRVCRVADAVLLGAVGGPQYDSLERALRPERGLLGIRRDLGLFANLRPAVLFDELVHGSSLKPERVRGLDMMIVRELTGDIYYGQPRGMRTNAQGEREAFNTMVYTESEIRRIAHMAFGLAMQRERKKLCSVDKANVLETTEFWKEVVGDVAKAYPQVQLTHMYIDNAAMQLVRNPTQFDVVLTGNLFGDILSDEAAMLTGSIGMLPSASLNDSSKGLYEPAHGSAPDIAGKNVANPLAAILSVAMMMRHSFRNEEAARRIEAAVRAVLAKGLRTGDIFEQGCEKLSCSAMGDQVVAALQ
jgi:3-isopropylmalate dehydrogenase